MNHDKDNSTSTSQGKGLAGQIGPMVARPQQPGTDADEIIKDLFSYHPARPDQEPRYRAVRTMAKVMAQVIVEQVPPGINRASAVKYLKRAVLEANQGIAVDGRSHVMELMHL